METNAVAQAVQTPVSAYDALNKTEGAPERELDLNAPRFFVQMGWNSIEVDTHNIVNRRLLRGDITPCITRRRRDHLWSIPDGMLIPGSETRDKDGRETWGDYYIHAHHEAERLLTLEGSAERKDGIFEVKALTANPRIFDWVDLNATFYPNGISNIPVKNMDVVASLRARLSAIESNPVGEIVIRANPNMPATVRPELLMIEVVAIGEELVKAALAVDAAQQSRLRVTHSGLSLKRGDEDYKREYDAADLEMLLRTGVPQKHDEARMTSTALNMTSQALDRLADGGGGNNSGMNAVLELMRQQGEQFAQQMAQMREEVAKVTERASRAEAQLNGLKSETKKNGKDKSE